ncbi:MAG: golgi uridine diphosphate-N- acetylglucosamine transporter [Pycnora praestabilis]|nr:MAG: golgi uridine diphosphate-N- acetylglucosamine transporter [Pycnora praestabilis]
MVKQRGADRSPVFGMAVQQASRRRSVQQAATPSTSIGLPMKPKEINAAPYLENAEMGHYHDGRGSIEKIIGLAGSVVHTTIPAWFQLGTMISLIFGGCCSNVYALEALVKDEPDSGLLITFVQFLFIAITSFPQQFSRQHPPFFLEPNAVPLRRWLLNILLFFSVNVLNNYAFGYHISVPVHIILRSGGSVMTMLVGWLWGKKFSRMQVVSVTLLTFGVVVAAMADAKVQGKSSSQSITTTQTFLTGLSILLLAQFLSALMGLYIQETYAVYGNHWRENLFYSHFLGLLLFVPFSPSMRSQYTKLASTSPPFDVPVQITPYVPLALQRFVARVPIKIAFLIANALTQQACIRGVNQLGARASALTVTIVLNVRKLVSLMLSIWIFGNSLDHGVLLGAAFVFGSGALYAWEGQRMGRTAGRGRGKKEL